ncbi:hypothetical protein A3A71_01445 [Candidatus Berkelbacteria bacterium RIFCSPLOWO2_01_FULL_50_28]|uniref:FAD/NAD(P)-binding domain-containing protein n=1 Tax=Candidatus Berkelbacteria bacterium RIFCSPLOWO2_01_FULL_50_28 TaxID=1797471 RepID=A0A1F5EBB2_9BACT|nr:MAG: hypothetical protein A2807_02015 [Candidatus Berkelbacteria bacterium RIFCSPHIGHO2_01_FULL_50_36]OGD63988.1 MAG: hypothetical protein A3F39_02850 [Candidatus Berkelbacteria bacterium RIFCSPHIGHO2_12_FULL_50_11]OGD64702.1 MAG: hypothetical protein A3A71_01445 [Candidatus Berkelbacteria bacterium RIFCSPLOWO2_01_FULL_50_28]
MSQRILIVGDSPLSYFIARLIDAELSRLAHMQVTHITTDTDLVYFPTISTVLGPAVFRRKKLENVVLKKETVMSINLKAKRVVTNREVYSYDYLILDLMPVITVQEFLAIQRSAKEVVVHLQAALKQNEKLNATVNFAGDIFGCQLALALARDRTKLSSRTMRKLAINVTKTNSTFLDSFLASNDISLGCSKSPGFNVGQARAQLSWKKIKGLTVDGAGHALTLPSLNLEKFQEVFVLDAVNLLSSLWRSQWVVAKQVEKNIVSTLERKPLRVIDGMPAPKYLTGDNGQILLWGGIESRRLRASAVGALDRAFVRRIS